MRTSGLDRGGNRQASLVVPARKAIRCASLTVQAHAVTRQRSVNWLAQSHVVLTSVVGTAHAARLGVPLGLVKRFA